MQVGTSDKVPVVQMSEPSIIQLVETFRKATVHLFNSLHPRPVLFESCVHIKKHLFSVDGISRNKCSHANDVASTQFGPLGSRLKNKRVVLDFDYQSPRQDSSEIRPQIPLYFKGRWKMSNRALEIQHMHLLHV